MIGYDSLLGSHYDRYYVEYYNFNTDDISPTVFAIQNSNYRFYGFKIYMYFLLCLKHNHFKA